MQLIQMPKNRKLKKNIKMSTGLESPTIINCQPLRFKDIALPAARYRAIETFSAILIIFSGIILRESS